MLSLFGKHLGFLSVSFSAIFHLQRRERSPKAWDKYHSKTLSIGGKRARKLHIKFFIIELFVFHLVPLVFSLNPSHHLSLESPCSTYNVCAEPQTTATSAPPFPCRFHAYNDITTNIFLAFLFGFSCIKTFLFFNIFCV